MPTVYRFWGRLASPRASAYFANMPLLLDGNVVATEVYKNLALELSLLSFIPKVVFILVGEDPASQTYVRAKEKKCGELGFQGETLRLPASTSQDDLLKLLQKLNKDTSVHGILVQLPLPPQIDRLKVLTSIAPEKDVDGLHPENMGRLCRGDARFKPCTPAGVVEMLKHYKIPVSGKNALVIGRSDIVGKPAAMLLLGEDATVTIAHSKTRDLKAMAKAADILIVAMGKPKFVGADFVNANSVVVDVGIHRMPDPSGKDKIVGDVDFEAVAPIVHAITPVPGGVGRMTIAMLMKNVVTAARLQSGPK